MPDSPDRMAWLIGQLASGDPDIEVLRELPTAVHSAIHPLCLSLVGGVDAARDAEQETWRRLLEHIARHHPRDLEIGNGTAYVRQIARNVCRDLGRRIRRDEAIDEVPEHRFSTGEPAWAEATVAAGSVPGGIRSPRVLRDLAGLSEQERAVLGLRQSGRSYQEIAQALGVTAGTAQTQGERALHHLRGRVHVEVWRQQPPSGWSVPACPRLAWLKAEIRKQLLAGKPVTAALYQEIGRHLAPRPKRAKGMSADPACQLCYPERKRSELVYWWLIATLPPVLAGSQLASPPSAAAAEDTDRTRHRRRRRPRARNLGIVIAAAVVVVALVVLVVLIIPRRDSQTGAQPQAGPGGTTASGGTAGQTFARPEPCTLLSQDDVAKAMGQPVTACASAALPTNLSPVDLKEATMGQYNALAIETDSVRIDVYKLGADPHSGFAKLCKFHEEIIRQFDPNVATGAIPGLGDENCTYNSRSPGAALDLGHTAVAARKGDIAVIVTVLWTHRHDLPTDLVKLALSRIG